MGEAGEIFGDAFRDIVRHLEGFSDHQRRLQYHLLSFYLNDIGHGRGAALPTLMLVAVVICPEYWWCLLAYSYLQ